MSDAVDAPATYELSCTDCQFETTVEGTPIEALDVANEHEQSYTTDEPDHFVNFRLAD